MPAGASAKREREYEKLKRSFEKEGRYKGREEEVASRIVNKQRAQQSETKAQKSRDRKGESKDAGLPIRDFDHLTVKQVAEKIGSLGRAELRKVETYERKHRNRATLMKAIDRARPKG